MSAWVSECDYESMYVFLKSFRECDYLSKCDYLCVLSECGSCETYVHVTNSIPVQYYLYFESAWLLSEEPT